MSLMDNMKNKMGDMNLDNMDRDTMMQRYRELSQRDQNGDLDEKGRGMMNKLKERLNM